MAAESLRDAGQGGVATREAGLPATTRQVHRAFLAIGQAPHREDLGLPEGVDSAEAFRHLDEVDLVHLDVGRIVAGVPGLDAPTATEVRA